MFAYRHHSMRSLLICISILFINNSFAQKLEIISGATVGWFKEIEGGDKTKTGSALGYNIGIRKPVHLMDGLLGFIPSLNYIRKGSAGGGGIFNYPDYRQHIGYVQANLPVGFIFRGFTHSEKPLRIGDYISGGIGPYVAFAAHGKKHQEDQINNTTVKRNLKFGNSAGNDFKKVDVGINYMYSILLGKLLLRIEYDMGLSNIAPQGSTEKLINRCVTLGVGFSIK